MNLDVKFEANNGDWLCFTHAVQRALTGEPVEPVVDDFTSDHDMRDTNCVECYKK